jgi:uncharacterized protein
MKFIINNLKLSLDEPIEVLKDNCAKKINVEKHEIKSFRIIKESVDARKKTNIQFVYSVIFEVDGNPRINLNNDVKILETKKPEALVPGNVKLTKRPVIIGTGPAGIFAGLILAQNGFKPLIFERGECVEKRTDIVNEYWKTGKLNSEINVQFGEGGAGTFSDGKLTTRINDRRSDIVLEELHRFGAGEEILYKAKPHIGTDVLKNVVVNMRKEIVNLGGEVIFNSKLTSVLSKDGKIFGILINGNQEIITDTIILAIGHSARDTYKSLFDGGVSLVPKPFSVGVRIEHSQKLINTAQYGKAAEHPRLGGADYQLFHKTGARTVYSFCMCPGGTVVASASEEDSIVTNGMSEFARDKENANSALVVSVDPKDFESTHPLSGIEFQRKWERLAFEIGGHDHSAPIQRLGDFIEGRATRKLGVVRPSYTGSTKISDLNLCLPTFITDSMKEAIKPFDNKLKGFGMADALLTGVETRTSSPLRILRNDSLEAIGFKGLYPAGEGAGYAGGIVSAAVDGIRIAEQIIKTYRPVDS